MNMKIHGFNLSGTNYLYMFSTLQQLVVTSTPVLSAIRTLGEESGFAYTQKKENPATHLDKSSSVPGEQVSPEPTSSGRSGLPSAQMNQQSSPAV